MSTSQCRPCQEGSRGSRHSWTRSSGFGFSTFVGSGNGVFPPPGPLQALRHCRYLAPCRWRVQPRSHYVVFFSLGMRSAFGGKTPVVLANWAKPSTAHHSVLFSILPRSFSVRQSSDGQHRSFLPGSRGLVIAPFANPLNAPPFRVDKVSASDLAIGPAKSPAFTFHWTQHPRGGIVQQSGT